MTESAETPIALTCADCGHAFRVRGRAAGRTVKCPGCSTPIDVPGPYDLPPLPSPTPAMPSFPVMATVTQESTNQKAEPIKLAESQPSRWSKIQRVMTKPVQLPASQMTQSEAADYAANAYLPAARGYPALEMIAGLYRLLGWLVVLATVVTILFMFTNLILANGLSALVVLTGIVQALPVALAGLIVAVLLFATTQIIRLSINVAGDVLTIAHASRRRTVE